MLLDPFEEASKDDTLVTDQPRRAIDRMRVAALDLEVRLAAGHEEAAGFVKAIEALEVEVATIHDAESAGRGQQLVEDVDLVHLAITDVNEGGDVAAQIEQRVDGFLQIDAEGLLRKQRPGDADQALGKIGIDAPVAHSVR